jgi:hypothetical protein
MLRKFSAALEIAQRSRSEVAMQKFLEGNPAALTCLVSPHTTWVFPRVALQEPLGGGHEPDFLICDWTSQGPTWTIVELESPTAKPINTRGISAVCRHAQQQISDYRRYMANSPHALHKSESFFAHRLKESWIVIGRRQAYRPEDRERLADLRQDKIEVASYDRLLEKCRDMVGFRVADRRRNREYAASLKGREKRN